MEKLHTWIETTGSCDCVVTWNARIGADGSRIALKVVDVSKGDKKKL